MKAEAARFLEAMFEKAQRKVVEHGRPPDPWNHFDRPFFVRRMKEEMAELEEAIETGDVTEMMDECIDVANFAMFMWIKLRDEQPALEREEP